MSARDREPVSVMVTGIGGGGFGEQIIKALRRAATPYVITGCDMSPLAKGLGAVDHGYVVPPAKDDRYVPVLLAIAARRGVRALFPGSEPELRVLKYKRAAFEQAGILLPINPDEVIEICLDKYRTMRELAERGFHVPPTVRVDHEQDLGRVEIFPVVLKPYIGAGGSADVTIAQDRAELFALGRNLLSSGRKLIAQEYVGTPDCEYTVGVLTSMRGELIHSIAVRRHITSALTMRLNVPNRCERKELGERLVISSGISQGEVGPFPEVAKPCEVIAASLGARGPINIQCRYVGGRVIVFEINPRFSGTTSLRALVGYNEPDLLVREHVLGERVQRGFAYGSGVVVRGVDEVLLGTPNFERVFDV
jgi:carbamoyl-phosphate synthase large subunit